jgi:hypothetical protein
MRVPILFPRPRLPIPLMIYAFLALQLALFLLSVGGYFQVKKFLGLHGDIANESNLDAFKSLVRVNMYVALVYLILGVPSVGMSIYFGFAYGISGLLLVVAISIPQFLFGKHLRGLEERSRTLPCRSDLGEEYAAVGHTWMKKALPNF